MTFLKRYRNFLILLAITIIAVVVRPDFGKSAVNITALSLREMMMILPPVFILLGLLDVWVPRETIIRLMGEGSGVKGIILAFIIGSAAAGPLYAAFPVAAVLMKKGVRFTNILIFIGAWSTTKIPMFLFEMASLGSLFAITRLLVNIPGIIIIAYILEKLTHEDQRREIYENARKIST